MAVKAGIPYFVRHGVPSYVVDQAGRGRSGFDQSVLHESEARLCQRRRQRRRRPDSQLRPHHRQRRVDGVVRSPGSAGLDGAHRHARSRTATPSDPNPKPDAYQHVAPLFPIEATDPNLVSRTGAHRTRTGAAPTATTRSSTTSSWSPTLRSRFPDRPARRAIRRSFHRPIPGRRRTLRRWSSASAGPSS